MPPVVEVFRWNPRRPAAARGPLRHVGLAVNNFGDLLGPLVVAGMRRRLGLADPVRDAQLLSVGSVLHLARAGAVVWGAGVNGKVAADRIPDRLDVRAVRGPQTARLLREAGHEVPDVFGDPALLLPELFPEFAARSPRTDVTVVPNLNEAGGVHLRRGVLHPRLPVRWCLRRITGSRLVVGSSLHGVIVAEAYGVPARLVAPQAESLLKYRDYYEATGRPGFRPGRSVPEAIELGGEPPPVFDPEPLMAAFPRDLWAPSGP